jgi:DNA-binding response OmpR family regulator
MAHVLVVEDETDLNNLIRDQLRVEGHTVEQAFDGRTALAAVERTAPDLVVLDWMLPDLDGLTVCRKLREQHLMPILMLTARAEEVDRVLGLEVGADDYLTKPFSMRELLARVRAQLRRIELEQRRRAPADDAAAVRVGGLTVDPGARTATLDGEPLKLTPTEFQLLHLFAANPGRAFSRDFLLERLWQNDYAGYERAIDTHVTRLRRKLGALGERIVTVWGVGYRFQPEEHA